jgi:hypothetical protein
VVTNTKHLLSTQLGLTLLTMLLLQTTILHSSTK